MKETDTSLAGLEELLACGGVLLQAASPGGSPFVHWRATGNAMP